MLGTTLEGVRRVSPLIHCITNYVTVNDVANMLLACGASPIMADDEREVAEITSICQGLLVNTGTLNERTIASMHIAGRRALELGHPILLDPVGAGASRLRTDTALELVRELRPTVVRGNISEIKCLALGSGATQGVDAAATDVVSDDTLDEAIALAQAYARSTGAVVAITGAIDLVAGAERACVVRNGHPLMSRVTGTGCQLSALTCAFVAAHPEDAFMACVAAVCTMGLAGELAHERLAADEGTASYRAHIIDAVYRMSAELLEEGARYELR